MKKQFIIFLCLFSIVSTFFSSFYIYAEQDLTPEFNKEGLEENVSMTGKTDPPPTLLSEAAVLMDAGTGQVLYQKNMDQKLYPASITKIMTVSLALEMEKLDAVAVMTDNATLSVPRDTSHIALTKGEEMSLENLLYAAMMPSANDACNGIAELICGEDGMKEYPVLMTQKAKQLGALNTNFANTNGLPDENHYTTAYDMALITKHAIQDPIFRTIFGKVVHKIPATNKNTEREFATLHSMLKNSKFKYEGAFGGKTGWTVPAEYTCVTVAKRNGRELIAVILKSHSADDRYIDTAALFDYGFDCFRPVVIAADRVPKAMANVINGDSITAVAGIRLKNDLTVLLHNSINESQINVTADIPKQFYGEVPKLYAHVALDGDSSMMYPVLGDYELETLVTQLRESIPVGTSLGGDNTDDENPEINPKKKSENGIAIALKTIGIILLLALLAVIIIFAMFMYSNIRRRRRARQRRLERAQRQSSDLKMKEYEQDKTPPPIVQVPPQTQRRKVESTKRGKH